MVRRYRDGTQEPFLATDQLVLKQFAGDGVDIVEVMLDWSAWLMAEAWSFLDKDLE